MQNKYILWALTSLLVGLSVSTQAEEENSDLAQDLTNPVADLITIPVQMNLDRNIGPVDDGYKLQNNVQPVIPFNLSENWNLITRTIVPIIHQNKIFPGSGSQSGLGDVSMSGFFSPVKPTAGGIIWGVGPMVLFPTATHEYLGAEKLAMGPTAVALTMRGSWTMGVLANHLFTVAGEDRRQDVRSTFVQPFVAYTWEGGWTVSCQSESTYNWETKKRSIPVNVALAKLVMVGGKLPVSVSGGVGYWLDSPQSGPEGFRFRLQANFVLPK